MNFTRISTAIALLFASGAATLAADLTSTTTTITSSIQPVWVDSRADAALESGWYLRADVGYSFAKLAFVPMVSGNRSAINFGGGVGYRITRNLRLDATAEYGGGYAMRDPVSPTPASGSTGKDEAHYTIKPLTTLANIYLDIPVTEVLSPYVGLGAGYSWFNDRIEGGPKGLKRSNNDRADGGFTWAAMGGVGINITEHFGFDVGYRFRQVMMEGPADFNDHMARAGIRYTF